MSKYSIGDRVCVVRSVPEWLGLVGLYGTILRKSDLSRFDWDVELDNKMRLYFNEDELRELTKLERALK